MGLELNNTVPFPERATQLYLALMMTVFLLWTGPGGYAKITFYKASAYVCLTGCYLAAMLFFAAKKRALVLEARKMTFLQWCVVGYWGASIFSTLFAVDRTRAFWGGPRAEGLLTISLYCGSFLLISEYARPRKWMLGLFGAAMSVNCLAALIQLGGYNPFGLYPAGMDYYDGLVRYGGQFLGTVGNVDLLSALLCIAVPAFWIGLLRLEGRGRFWLLIPIALSIAVLFFSWVEGGVVSMMGSLILGLPVVLKDSKGRAGAAVGSAAVLIGALTAVFFFGDGMEGFLFEAHELLHGRMDESFGSGRIYIWSETWKLVPERLLLGGGPETLGLRTQAAFERFDAALGVTLRSGVDTAHNEYLNILVNQGLLALLCWLGALAGGAAGWVKRAGKSPAAAICGGGVLGYCIQAFFGISSPITTPFLWIVFGLLSNAIRE